MNTSSSRIPPRHASPGVRESRLVCSLRRVKMRAGHGLAARVRSESLAPASYALACPGRRGVRSPGGIRCLPSHHCSAMPSHALALAIPAAVVEPGGTFPPRTHLLAYLNACAHQKLRIERGRQHAAPRAAPVRSLSTDLRRSERAHRWHVDTRNRSVGRRQESIGWTVSSDLECMYNAL